MTLRAGHELHMLLAVMTGFVAVLSAGAAPPVAWALLALLPLACWLRLAGGRIAGQLGTLLAVLAVVAGLGYVATQGVERAVDAGTLTVMVLLLVRLVTREHMTDDQQALLLALMLVAAGGVLGTGPVTFLWVVLFCFAASAALITCEWLAAAMRAGLRAADVPSAAAVASRQQTSAAPRVHLFDARTQEIWARKDLVTPRFWLWITFLSLWVLALAGLLFAIFPRTGALVQLGSTSSRWLMPNQVALGSPPRGAAPAEVVARINGLNETQFLQGLYLRGAVYDEPNKLGFARHAGSRAFAPDERMLAAAGAPPVVYEIFAVPVAQDLLFSLGPATPETVALRDEREGGEPRATVWQDRLGGLHVNSAQSSAHRYQVVGPVVPLRFGAARGHGALHVSKEFMRQFVALPDELDPRIAALAARLVDNAEDFSERAARLRNHLLEHATYSLLQPNAQRSDPLASFLFDDPRGHCEYFATAYAVLLRAAGVPSRVVGGYQGGSWEPQDGQAIFTADNAHVWVEWYLPGAGWVVDDATPASTPRQLTGWAAWSARMHRLWDDHIATFGFAEQLTAVSQLTESWQRLARTARAWRAYVAAPEPGRQALRYMALGALILCAWGLGRRVWHRRQGDRLGRVLWQQLLVLSASAPGAGTTARELLGGVQRRHHDGKARQPAALLATLERAIEIHEAQRFGGFQAADEARRLVRALTQRAAK